jgi:hypothetical protein
MSTPGRAPFTATHRVIHRIHCNRPYARPFSQPSRSTCFADGNIFMIGISNRTYGCPAFDFHQPNFTGT